MDIRAHKNPVPAFWTPQWVDAVDEAWRCAVSLSWVYQREEPGQPARQYRDDRNDCIAWLHARPEMVAVVETVWRLGGATKLWDWLAENEPRAQYIWNEQWRSKHGERYGR